ncbi:MAG: hypothetical protein H6712_22240 [Myxococcales bacterium]|nr:hypothetical protein [Myxococcales bacterium]MCB9716595.1 hypothetical protein [Myxococcales bacterium]
MNKSIGVVSIALASACVDADQSEALRDELAGELEQAGDELDEPVPVELDELAAESDEQAIVVDPSCLPPTDVVAYLSFGTCDTLHVYFTPNPSGSRSYAQVNYHNPPPAYTKTSTAVPGDYIWLWPAELPADLTMHTRCGGPINAVFSPDTEPVEIACPVYFANPTHLAASGFQYQIGYGNGDPTILERSAERFCLDQGYAGHIGSITTQASYGVGQTWYANNAWQSTGGQYVVLISGLWCIDATMHNEFLPPKHPVGASSYQLGHGTGDASIVQATADEFCVDHGYAHATGLLHTRSSYGYGHAWFEGGSWHSSGGQPVVLIDKLTCAH